MNRHLHSVAASAGRDRIDVIIEDTLAARGIVPAGISREPDGVHVLVPVWQAETATQALLGAQGVTQIETTDTLFVTVLVRDAPASRFRGPTRG